MIAFADPVFHRVGHEEEAQPRDSVTMRSLPSFYDGSVLNIEALVAQLPPLPGTRKEVEQIASSLQVPKSDIKLGVAATETAVKQAKLEQYRIVYFATHALVSGDLQNFAKAGTEPALVFTIPEQFDDGLLYASEAAQLKLNADWVVLSACNTASADSAGAEALSGLARAFFYAGARSLLVSHWQVSDISTPQLMTSIFSAAQSSNLSHAELLQRAQIQILDKATSASAAHPRNWAPFVVVGEPAKSLSP